MPTLFFVFTLTWVISYHSPATSCTFCYSYLVIPHSLRLPDSIHCNPPLLVLCRPSYTFYYMLIICVKVFTCRCTCFIFSRRLHWVNSLQALIFVIFRVSSLSLYVHFLLLHFSVDSTIGLCYFRYVLADSVSDYCSLPTGELCSYLLNLPHVFIM